MKETTVKLIALAGATVVTVGIIAAGTVRSHIAYKKEMRRIETEKDLDLEAIRRTGDAMQNKISNGEFRGIYSVAPILSAFEERLAFEKIAVREDK